MVKSDGARREFTLGKDRVVIGRTTGCDLRIPIPSVSRQHCELTIAHGEVKVRDLGSSNGTFHNDKRVQEVTLAAGDRITVGSIVFGLLIDGQPAELMQPAVKQSAPPKGKVLSVNDDEVPAIVDEEDHSPTVDLDDPVAALQALAHAMDEAPARTEDKSKHAKKN